MIKKDEFETIINNLRGKLDETSVALVSEELLQTISAFNNGYDEYEKIVADKHKLKSETEELLNMMLLIKFIINIAVIHYVKTMSLENHLLLKIL